MPIKTWPIKERPREKLFSQGVCHLSDAELLAILLETGRHGKTAVDLALELLKKFKSLNHLFDARIDEINQIAGLGPSKTARLQIVPEISRRCLFEKIQQNDVLKNIQQTKDYLIAQLGYYKQEIFGCLFLDNKHRVMVFQELFRGSIDRADVYPREVVKAALAINASAVILAHNHPSGDPEPSKADQTLSQQLKSTLITVDIRVLDHIIIGHNQALSMVEMGLF